eukprot:g6460.t1
MFGDPGGAGEVEMEGLAEAGGAEGLTAAPVVAFAISVTSLDLPKAATMLDSAEVLLHSIRASCEFSRYRCETFAFALPSVSPRGLRHLETMGWRIMEKDLPVAVEDIENETYRNHVVKSGCCGADEFIKLHAYTLTDYHRVVHLDADTLILHPMDELLELDASLVYTTDPAMVTPGSKAMPIQGGFLLVRPDLEVYEALRAIVREGDWKVGKGWRSSLIGYFYGGATIQGLLPFYYTMVAPGTAREVNRCIYNHMWDSPECRSDRYTLIAIGEEGAEGTPLDLNSTPEAAAAAAAAIEETANENETRLDLGSAPSGVSAIKSVHFTQECTKPWLCGQLTSKKHRGSCQLLQQAWRDGRKSVMATRGLPSTSACSRKGYSPIPRS